MNLKNIPFWSVCMMFSLLSVYSLNASKYPSWEEQQAKAEKHTVEYLEMFTDVRSDRFVYKTITLPNGDKLELDLRLERPKTGGPFPVVFYIHGGAWVTGNKDNFYRQSFRMASENQIAGVRIEYRWKSHGGDYLDVIGDVMDSIDSIRQRADELNLDFTRVGIAGSSAGAHLGAIAAQHTPECISFDGFNGIYDLVDRDKSRFGGDAAFIGASLEDKKRASAFWQIRNDPPDTWLYHGTYDLTIDWVQSRRFAKAIKEHGGQAETLIYSGYGHGVNRLDQKVYEATTQALLAHTAYVFGIRDKKPNPQDYIVNKEIPEVPEGFSLQGVWRRESHPNQTFTFYSDYSALAANGDRIGWKEVDDGRYYIVWKSGGLGRIDILAKNKVKMASATYIKDVDASLAENALLEESENTKLSIVGKWQHMINPAYCFVFNPDGSAVDPKGNRIGWKMEDDRYFIVWKSGRLGRIDVIDSTTVKMASSTFSKVEND
ncbi:alpha/beta hydrolase [Coraliomargarita sp. SDUM461004]|uniref:Alpha/beta hydrolase n=1 Tax=Thalassobacterium sedimentorum TaxID=3041258 RepID=A0ABU1AE61_9BACT|nr:alpha/beta hydrolase [Coraliomargarita sp. SDUM461004]MDQ8193021.1 alpha/beta hydrolase [Coraliomargarita sp. SDUM461004]